MKLKWFTLTLSLLLILCLSLDVEARRRRRRRIHHPKGPPTSYQLSREAVQISLKKETLYLKTRSGTTKLELPTIGSKGNVVDIRYVGPLAGRELLQVFVWMENTEGNIGIYTDKEPREKGSSHDTLMSLYWLLVEAKDSHLCLLHQAELLPDIWANSKTQMPQELSDSIHLSVNGSGKVTYAKAQQEPVLVREQCVK